MLFKNKNDILYRMAVSEEKTAMRSTMRDLMSSMHLVKRAGDEISLCDRLLSLPAVRNAKTVGVYQAIGSELSIEAAISEMRKNNPQITIAFPAIVDDGVMNFAVVKSSEVPPFVENPLEKVENTSLYKWVDPQNFELLLVPGLAFNEHCARLGHGGGYYDQYIAKLSGDCMTIGIAFDEQIVEDIPMDTNDKYVDYVVTPTRLITRY